MKAIPRVSAKKYRGLGDVVHAVALPAAKAIDRVFRTALQHCKGCGKRQEDWNRKVPFK